MQINKAILHRIAKDKNTSGAGSAVTVMRAEILPIDERLERTVDDIVRIYGKSTSGYGTFDPNETVYRFPVLLHDYVVNGNGFVPFTIESTRLIAARMGDEIFATGGYSLFLRYNNQGQDWLLVAMLMSRGVHSRGVSSNIPTFHRAGLP